MMWWKKRERTEVGDSVLLPIPNYPGFNGTMRFGRNTHETIRFARGPMEDLLRNWPAFTDQIVASTGKTKDQPEPIELYYVNRYGDLYRLDFVFVKSLRCSRTANTEAT